MPDLSLRVAGLEKSFDDNHVVRNLSLEIRTGEIFTLLGASGCGKSTTLRIIAGLETADAGVVEFNGRQWVDVRKGLFVPPQRRGIGMVFQNYAIWPHMTVFQHVAYPLRILRMEKQKIVRRVEEILNIVGLGGLQDRPAVMLSGGQQQRVAVARALAHEPDLLLFDEPFSNLDVNLREQLRIELKQIQMRLGLTIILVTHDQLDAFTLSDRIGVMRNGQIEQIDDGRVMYERPTNQFVREFVGRSVMLHGVLKSRDGVAATVAFGAGGSPGGGPDGGTDGLVAGDPVSVWMRPEDLRFGPDHAGASDAATLPGTITSAVFLGDRYGCGIGLDCGQEIWTYVPRALHPKPGDRMRLSVDPREGHITRRAELPGATGSGTPGPRG
jgi:ABC-type Fe3+/spermidine/putrescine transport system ATPase subunit